MPNLGLNIGLSWLKAGGSGAVGEGGVPANAITDPTGGAAITDPDGGAYITDPGA